MRWKRFLEAQEAKKKTTTITTSRMLDDRQLGCRVPLQPLARSGDDPGLFRWEALIKAGHGGQQGGLISRAGRWHLVPDGYQGKGIQNSRTPARWESAAPRCWYNPPTVNPSAKERLFLSDTKLWMSANHPAERPYALIIWCITTGTGDGIGAVASSEITAFIRWMWRL